MGFELRALVTEGTKTGFGIKVLSKLTLLDLLKLCLRLYLLEGMGDKPPYVSVHLKSIPPLPYGFNFQDTQVGT